MIAKYESVMLFAESTTQEEIDAFIEKVRQTAKGNDGSVEAVEPWGKRDLAYELGKHRAAHYVLLRMTGTGMTVKEVERLYRLDERVIRHLTVAAEEAPKVKTEAAHV